MTDTIAPDGPGTDARWAPGPKDIVGTAFSDDSSVWFTVGKGILNEVYYPAIDTPSIKDMGFIVTDNKDYLSEEQSQTDSTTVWCSPGVPAFKVTNIARDGRYTLVKKIISDPDNNCLLQQVEFKGKVSKLSLYAHITPHLGGMGSGNNARIIRHGQQSILVAERDNCALALVCSTPFLKATTGFVGVNDGWEQLKRYRCLDKPYMQAMNGNISLSGEIDLRTCDGKFILALGFGPSIEEAIITALDSLGRNFKETESKYKNGWKKWLDSLTKDTPDMAKISLAVIKCHESKNPAGGLIAGLATPWGFSQGDNDRNGYHVVWTRDMVEAAGGLIAAGKKESVLSCLEFLSRTQQPDGHWPQNMWTDGTPYWNGIQMDETALPILLVNLAKREQAISDDQALSFWPLVKKAATFLMMNGPVTQQDRWEEDPGYTPFTLAAEIAALLAAADLADLNQENNIACIMRETADIWYDCIDDWLYSQGTDWTQKYSVAGYYERIMPLGNSKLSRYQQIVHVKNVEPENASMPAINLISPDALALVRFGLRTPEDKRITDTIKIIDELIKIETPFGPTWHRYNDDGYGENEDGSPFNGTGVGRGWPLLTGERAHYELAANNHRYAAELKETMERFANSNGLYPEQVWDSEDIPEHDLYKGKATGSATPLAWAHAEYLKLLRSQKDGRIFDMPEQTVKRYLRDNTTSDKRAWRFNNKLRQIPAGKNLRIETLSACTIHYSIDGWKTSKDINSSDSGLGIYIADLPTGGLNKDEVVEFTFYWTQAKDWENRNFSVTVR